MSPKTNTLSNLANVTAGKVKTSGITAFNELVITKVYPNPNQPRKQFDDIEELAANIKEHGLLQPITVVKKDDGYMIVSGERRYKAHLHNGAKTIMALILTSSDEQVEELTLIENIQRSDLTDFEVAKYILRLWESGRYAKKSDLANRIGKSDSFVSKAFSCFKLDSEIIDHIEENKKDIPISVMDEIARVKDKGTQKEVYEKYSAGEIIRDEIKDFKPKKTKIDHFKIFEDAENDLVGQAKSFNENFPRENLKKYELEICCKDGILYQSDIVEAYNKGNALLKAHLKYPSYLKEGYVEEEYSFFLTQIEIEEEKQKFVFTSKKAENDKSISFDDEGFFYFVNYARGGKRTFKIGKTYKITIEEI
jgi:ParB/RepB/Spo0J family partition protein